MLRLGDSVSHRALGFLYNNFLSARGVAPCSLSLTPQLSQATFSSSGVELREWDSIICAMVGTVPLLGSNALERAEVIECLNVFQPPGDAKTLSLLEGRLARRSYVAGPRLSVADALALYTAVPVLAGLKAADFPETSRWLRQLDSEVPQLYSGEGAPKRPVLPTPPSLSDVLASFEAAAAAPGAGASAAAVGGGGGGGDAAAPAPKKEKKAAAPPAPSAPAEDRSVLSEMDFGVGQIIEAWPHPESVKLWCEKIRFGPDAADVREIASGLRAYYTQEQMVGQRVIVVRNLKARKVAGFSSNGMVLCAKSVEGGEEKVEFLAPPEGAKLGERITFEGHAGPPAEPNRVDKKKVSCSLSLSLSLSLSFCPFFLSFAPFCMRTQLTHALPALTSPTI